MLPDVPNRPQTSAGGQYPNEDCFEENSVSLANRFGFTGHSVREAEQWEAAHGGSPQNGTALSVGSALLKAWRIPNSVRYQSLDAAASRNHYFIALVKSSYQGIPQAGGPALHFVTYLGEGWYRNPANGTLVNSPPLGPAYTGEGIEINLNAIPQTGDISMADAQDILNELGKLEGKVAVTGYVRDVLQPGDTVCYPVIDWTLWNVVPQDRDGKITTVELVITAEGDGHVLNGGDFTVTATVPSQHGPISASGQMSEMAKGGPYNATFMNKGPGKIAVFLHG